MMSALSTGFNPIENRMLVGFNIISGCIFNGIVHYLQYELVIKHKIIMECTLFVTKRFLDEPTKKNFIPPSTTDTAAAE